MQRLVVLVAGVALRSAAAEECEDGFVDLRILVCCGKVPDKDVGSKSDPTVRISLGSDERQTSILIDEPKPEWNQYFDFGCERLGGLVEVEVFDYDWLFPAEKLFDAETTDWTSGVMQRLYMPGKEDRYVDIMFEHSGGATRPTYPPTTSDRDGATSPPPTTAGDVDGSNGDRDGVTPSPSQRPLFSSSKSKSTSTKVANGAGAAIIVLLVLLLAACILGFGWQHQRRRIKPPAPSNEQDLELVDATRVDLVEASPVAHHRRRSPNSVDAKLLLDDIELEEDPETPPKLNNPFAADEDVL